MIDGVPYATGRGYLLKAISTFLASYPTYSDFVSALVAGTLPIDISFNSPGWSTQPTPLNKANLLDDTVAAALKTLAGLSSNPATPNAALSALATAVAGGAKIATGSYTGNGLYGSSHPCSLTFPFVPAFVWIYAQSSSGISFATLSGCTTVPMSAITTSYVQNKAPYWSTTGWRCWAKKSSDGKTLYWYNTYGNDMDASLGAVAQLNDSGKSFYYMIWG